MPDEEKNITVNKVPEEVKKEYTNEFILLAILSYAKKLNYKLGRMQLVKILQKFKQRIQEELAIQAYHNPLFKDKHGDFNPVIYKELTSLKKADFIKTVGAPPFEKFVPTDYGSNLIDKIRMSTGEDNERLQKAKNLLEKLIPIEAAKDAGTLRTENHERIVSHEGTDKPLDDVPDGAITTPNLEGGQYLIFDDRLAIDWSLYLKIAERKRDEVVPESNIPKTQEEALSLLGLK